MKFLKKNLSYVALVIVIIGAAVYYMGRDTSGGDIVTEGAPPSSSTEAAFLSYSSELDSVVFEADIFSDPRFTRLQDISTSIVAEEKGRRDPFAPLPGVVVTP